MLKQIALACGLALTVAGCASSNWETNYTQVPAEQATQWRVAAVNVTAPETLTTSEENSYVPSFDVVWHGEPYGDRRAQAAAILREGIQRGAAVAKGKTPVRIEAVVEQFHAITPVTRNREWMNAGVHDIRYTVQVFNARTGDALTQPQLILADLPALTGKAGDEADAKGFTQRVQIVNHIAAVTRNWLGHGQDMRKSFSRLGR